MTPLSLARDPDWPVSPVMSPLALESPLQVILVTAPTCLARVDTQGDSKGWLTDICTDPREQLRG